MAGEPGAAGQVSCRLGAPSSPAPSPRKRKAQRMRVLSELRLLLKAPAPHTRSCLCPRPPGSRAPSAAHRPGRPVPAPHRPPSGFYLRDCEWIGPPAHRHIPLPPSQATSGVRLTRPRYWRRKWRSNPVLLPGESHGQRSLVGYSPWGRKDWDMTEQLIHTTCGSDGARGRSRWRTGNPAEMLSPGLSAPETKMFAPQPVHCLAQGKKS